MFIFVPVIILTVPSVFINYSHYNCLLHVLNLFTARSPQNIRLSNINLKRCKSNLANADECLKVGLVH